MEKLTGKCKEDFMLWHFERNTPIEEYSNFPKLSETCKNALIIEFFDSVGIRIGIDPYYDMSGTYRVNIEQFGFQSMYRNEAMNEVIKHANKIYNDTK